MIHANPFAPGPQGVSYQATDAGASGAGASSGGGAGAASGQGAAGGAGQANATGATAGNGASGVSPVSLADDTPVTIGGKTYSSFKDYRSEFEGGTRTATQAEIRANIAKLAQQLQRNGQLGQRQQPQQQRVDPFEGVRDMAFVDGKTLENLYQKGLGPIAQAIQQLQQHVSKQNQTIQQLRGGVAPLAERHSTQEFQNRINTGIATLNGVDAKDPFVSELAQDVFHSYEWAKGKEDAEYQKYLGERYSAAEKHFKAKFANELKAAKERKWQRPGGNVTPSGPPKSPWARKSTAEIARDMFAQSPTGT